ncbi:murein biosynthesis integral membrane protein MurJ [Formosa haliotis]|uniref:murein biosynthesis integral membrane protein MurJ n=1 Tax=Formosa haliotis TaxID=1555194 RepID=UPI0008250AE9|nr:lipid II flippase MurJ [Formosa haliotis]
MTFKFKYSRFIRSILKNATLINILIVALTTLLVKGIGFFKEIVIANNFGISELLDTFYIAILIPGLISNIFLSGFKSVFIPNYVLEKEKSTDIGAFQSSCFIITVGISLFFCIIALLTTDVYLELFFKGHTVAYYELIKIQLYYIIPSIIFWGLSSLLSGLLTIDNEFTFSSIGSIFIPITIIISLLFFKEELGPTVLALSTLLGSILNFIFLSIVSFRRNIIHLKKPDLTSSNITMLFKQLPAKLTSNLFSGLNQVVDQYFAAQLIIGSIAALNYGVKIPMFAIGIATIALGNVLLPYFSKNATNDPNGNYIKLNKILKIIVVSSSLISILLIIISTPIISLIFERNAFTNADTLIVSKIQQMYLLQIPAYISGIIMVRFLTSINKNNFMAIAAIFSLILNIILNYYLVNILGVFGLALSTSIVSATNSIILYIYIKHLNKLKII